MVVIVTKLKRWCDMQDTVYLAGPMKDCNRAETHGWRAKAEHRLTEGGIDVIDPSDETFPPEEALERREEIVQKDLRAIASSEVVLAHMWKPSIGTSMEVWVAGQTLGKDVYVVSDNISPWAKYCATDDFAELADALNHIARVYG